jgi:hypothetical protein
MSSSGISITSSLTGVQDTDEFHSLNYQQLKNAQDKDKTSQKILKMPKTLYICARTSMGEERQPHWHVLKKGLSFQNDIKSMLL